MNAVAKLITTLALGAALLSPLTSQATPVTYLFDDSAAGGLIGKGIFTIDIGTTLKDYNATFVLGGLGSVLPTPWTGVQFGADLGDSPFLLINAVKFSSAVISEDAIGGGAILPGSNALAEWNNFMTEANREGYKITPLTHGVPDGGSLVGVIGLAFVGMFAVQRSQRSEKMAKVENR
jgi:hypothetical protein